jgi:uncharacterized membrane protein YecN with MAPEG domain
MIWFIIVVGIILFIGALLIWWPLCKASYRADEAMGMQEWQVSEEERQKGYRRGN